jgi:membrane protein implicated in regulation of membrane protease activity
VRTNVEALKGRPGIVLSPIEGSVKPGLVKVGGEKWSAVCEEETHITKGSRVEVLEVVGNKVRVKAI